MASSPTTTSSAGAAQDPRPPSTQSRRRYRIGLTVESSDDIFVWRRIRDELGHLDPCLQMSDSGTPVVTLHLAATDDLTASDYALWRAQRLFDTCPDLSVQLFVDRVTVS